MKKFDNVALSTLNSTDIEVLDFSVMGKYYILYMGFYIHVNRDVEG